MNGEILKALAGLGGVPFVVALVQLIKPFIPNDKFFPLIAMGFGVVLNLVLSATLPQLGRSEWVASILQGIIVGLAASGLYRQGSIITEK